MRNSIEPITDTNLSVAWAKGFLQLMSQPGGEISPFIVSVRGISRTGIEEDFDVKSLLNAELISRSLAGCETVANTIFPLSMWNPRKSAEILFKRYKTAWPRIKRVQSNRRGVYFQRLVDFDEALPPGNQLAHIISTWKSGNHRHSALQAAIFDPRRDHNDARQLGFPCLHQVAFSPLGSNGEHGLAVTGFYATQTMFEKAYGNFLGLGRLGSFMATQMGLRLVEVTCIAALEKLSGKFRKRDLAGLADSLSRVPSVRAALGGESE